MNYEIEDGSESCDVRVKPYADLIDPSVSIEDRG